MITPKVMIKTTMTSILSIKCPMDTSLAALSMGKLEYWKTSAPTVMIINIELIARKIPAVNTAIKEIFLPFFNLFTLVKITVKTTNSPKGNTSIGGNIDFKIGFIPSPRIGCRL